MKTVTMPIHGRSFITEVILRLKRSKLFSILSSNYNFLILPGAFLLGRAELAEGLSPFGFAFYAAAAAGTRVNKLLLIFSILAGLASGGKFKDIYITAIAMLIYTFLCFVFKRLKGNSMLKPAFISFSSILIPDLLLAGFQGLLLYDILGAFFNAFIVFVIFFVFRNTLLLLSEASRIYLLGNEEMISLAITAALMVSGIGSFRIFGFSPENLICIIIIIVFSYKCGAGVGAATGVAIGLIISLSTDVTPLAIGTFAFCGLLAGVLKSLGKIGSGLGFVLGNSILSIYLSSSVEALFYFQEIMLSVIIFLILPKKVIDVIAGPFAKDAAAYSDRGVYSKKIREITFEKLDKFSRAFRELSKTFGEISQTKIVTDKQDISVLFDKVADRVCRDCSLCLHCWDRNFYNTYQVMFKIVEVLEDKGRIDENGIPAYFLERCERINSFVEAVNRAYEIFKVDMVWKSRIGESRGLISQQFESLSNVIFKLAYEIDTDVKFVKGLEDEVCIRLCNLGIKCNEAAVYQNNWGKYEAIIRHSGCGGARVCISAIGDVISDVIGRQMTTENGECRKSKEGLCVLKFVEEEKLKVSGSVAKTTKHGSEISGDNFSFMNIGNGKFVAALSDGMGSGLRASVQSRATVDMLENFLESGFEKDMAVKLVNSVLVMKSSDDTFSTMDVAMIDLFSGETEFVKIGAAPSYLKKNERVEMIKAASLPAGILSELDTELMHRKVDTGDMLIMVTDGIVDSFENEGSGDRMLMKYIQELKLINPQQLADNILEKACSNCGGEALDDMTVLVAKVWKKHK